MNDERKQAIRPKVTKGDRNRLVVLPLFVAENPNLTANERLACLLMTRWAIQDGIPSDRGWVSNEMLAAQLGVKQAAAIRTIRSLAKKGVIRLEYDRTKPDAKQRTIIMPWRLASLPQLTIEND